MGLIWKGIFDTTLSGSSEVIWGQPGSYEKILKNENFAKNFSFFFYNENKKTLEPKENKNLNLPQITNIPRAHFQKLLWFLVPTGIFGVYSKNHKYFSERAGS